MQFYEVNCSLNKSVDRRNRNSLVVETKSNEYNTKNEQSHVIITSNIDSEKITLGFVAINNIRNIKPFVIKYLDMFKYDYSDIFYEEVRLEDFNGLCWKSSRNDYMDKKAKSILSSMNIEGLVERDYDNFMCSDNLISCLKKNKVYKEIEKYSTKDSLKEELNRIYGMKTSNVFLGHPTHYFVYTDDVDVRRETCKLLINALYEKNRIYTKRYSFANIKFVEYGFPKNVYDNFYKINIGGTVIVRVDKEDCKNEEILDDPDSMDIIKYVCDTMKKYKNKVLTIFCLPHNDKLKDMFLSNLGGNTFVTIEDYSTFTIEDAKKYLLNLAKDKGIDVDNSLFNAINETDMISQVGLEEYFNNWYEEKLKKDYFLDYQDINAIEEKPEEITEDKDEVPIDAYTELMNMIGIKSAKEVATKAINFFKAKKLFKDMGMNTDSISMHMVFMGNPGTAKTTVARLFAQIMKENGILKKGHMVEVGRGGLVGKYVGHTAKIVQDRFKEASGGVLFIDEAYSLVDDKRGLYGDEAINTIVQEMENHREDVIVIFAGYTERMKEFLNINPGLRSRIACHLMFEDYTADELCDIAKYLGDKQGLVLPEETIKQLREKFEIAKQTPDFGNGRYVRNVLENAKLEHASRLVNMDIEKVTKEDVQTITVEDIQGYSLTPSTKQRKKIGFGA